MKFEIVEIGLLENKHGKNDIIISKVKVTEDNGEFIKFAKLNKYLIEAMQLAGKVSIKG